jgi:hypothetical protein
MYTLALRCTSMSRTHCGLPPERCVRDEEVLTQYGLIRSPFRSQPRIALELGLSVLRGQISLEDATR